MTQPFEQPNPEAFVASVKSGKGHEAALLAVRAGTVAELNHKLEELANSGTLDRLANLNHTFQAMDALASGGLQPQQIQQAAPPAGYQQMTAGTVAAPQQQYASPNQSPEPPPPWATGGAVAPAQVPVPPSVQGQGQPYAPQGYSAPPPAQQQPVYQQQPPQQAAPAQGAPNVQPPVCPHGPRVWATGPKQNGRGNWFAWDCSAKGGNYACEQDRLWARKDGQVSAR